MKDLEAAKEKAINERKQKILTVQKVVTNKYEEIFKGVNNPRIDRVILPHHEKWMQKAIVFYKPDFEEMPILDYDKYSWIY